MMLRMWDDVPEFMRCEEVKVYYDILSRKKCALFAKRIFDVTVSMGMMIIMAIPMLGVGIMIKIDSPGPVLYRQERVTSFGKRFRIHKFRTMVDNAEKLGSAVTVDGDARVTRVGRILRRFRIDEIPQLIDVFLGDMTFVGTRPEAVKYVEMYTKEMYATLLLPAGVTSEASIRYKDEANLISSSSNVDDVYVRIILPRKMAYNLSSIKNFSFWGDLKTMVRTVLAVGGKNYS